MKIALDYDNTYTKNPIFWDKFIDLCHSFTVDVRIVTLRPETNPIPHPLSIPIIHTNYKQKRDHCNQIGWMPDIFIDDLPEFIISESLLDIKFRDGEGCEIKFKKK